MFSLFILFRRNLVFTQYHRYPYLSISFFAFDIRCPCSPTCSFVPSLGPSYRRLTLPSYPFTSIDFRFPVHRSSYRSSVSIASLWPDCGASVSCSVRRFCLFLEPPSSVVNLLIGVSFLCGLSFQITAFSSISSPLVVYGLCYCRSCLMDHWICIGIAQERDPEEGRTVTNLGRRPLVD
jgi:hypothetical protein